MKLSSALPLVVAAKLLVPTNGAVADEPQVPSSVSDGVNFNPDTGELTLEGMDGLSPEELEGAFASILGGFRQLVDGCLESGTPGGTNFAPEQMEYTVNCGNGGPVVSCTFRERRHAAGVACEYPDGGTAGLAHATSVRSRKIPGLTGECGLHDGCMEKVTDDIASFSGTDTAGDPNDGGNVKLELRGSKTEVSNRGDSGDLSGWDLVKSDGDTGLIGRVSAFMSGMKERFASARKWTPRGEGKQY